MNDLPALLSPQKTVELRRDAKVRRERLLAAAVELFLEEGVDVPLEKIADRAKVGRATLYRNFADRGELLDAAVQVYLTDFYREVVAAGDDAYFVGICAIARLTVASNGMEKRKWMRDRVPAIIDSYRDGIERILAEPLERAKRVGLIRDDFPLGDSARLALMIAGGALHDREIDPIAAMQRSLDLLKEGLAPRRTNP